MTSPRVTRTGRRLPELTACTVALAVLAAACAGAGYAPPRSIELRSHPHPKPLGFDGSTCRGWLDPALAFPDADDPQIHLVPHAPVNSRCENRLPGYGAEMLSREPVRVPAWVTGRIRVGDVRGARYAFFLYDDGHEVTVELDRETDGWVAAFATFRPDSEAGSDRIVATHLSRTPLDSLAAGDWHTVSIHRSRDGVEAYLDGRLLGRARPDGCAAGVRCLPEGPLRLRLNAWAPDGLADGDLAGRAVYRIAWARIGEGPRAAFRVEPPVPTAGRPVRFTGRRSGTSGARRIASWEWDFGDGAVGEGPEPTHRYGEPGEYTATLVVADSEGARDTLSRVLTVEPAGPGRSP